MLLSQITQEQHATSCKLYACVLVLPHRFPTTLLKVNNLHFPLWKSVSNNEAHHQGFSYYIKVDTS